MRAAALRTVYNGDANFPRCSFLQMRCAKVAVALQVSLGRWVSGVNCQGTKYSCRRKEFRGRWRLELARLIGARRSEPDRTPQGYNYEHITNVVSLEPAIFRNSFNQTWFIATRRCETPRTAFSLIGAITVRHSTCLPTF